MPEEASFSLTLQTYNIGFDDNKLKFAGYITLDFIDANSFYSHYQISRVDRKNIKNINFAFLFNLDDKVI